MLAGIFETFYQVTTASDGVEALDIIQKDTPSIILSDVVMPRMSGTELCKQIKTDFNTCHIPVVLLTARTAVEHNIEGLKIGATIISPSRSIPISDLPLQQSGELTAVATGEIQQTATGFCPDACYQPDG